jgi:hypothetical protein
MSTYRQAQLRAFALALLKTLVVYTIGVLFFGPRPAAAGVGCEMYNLVYGDVNETILVGSFIIGALSLLIGVAGLIIPGVREIIRGGIAVTFLSIGVLLALYANLTTILEGIANFSGGAIDIATALAAC